MEDYKRKEIMTMIAVDDRPNTLFDEKILETSFWTTERHLLERSLMIDKVRIALYHSRIYVDEEVIQHISDTIGECKFHEIPERIRLHGEQIMRGTERI